MSTNDAFVDKITAVMQNADEKFFSVGGGTRRYVRDVLLPLMEKAGLFIVDSSDVSSAVRVLSAALLKDKSEGSYYFSWQSAIAMAFKDEFDAQMESRVPNFTQWLFLENGMHEIANNAAQNFLDTLITVSDDKAENHEG